MPVILAPGDSLLTSMDTCTPEYNPHRNTGMLIKIKIKFKNKDVSVTTLRELILE